MAAIGPGWDAGAWVRSGWADSAWGGSVEVLVDPIKPRSFRVTMHSNPIAMVVKLIDNVGFRTRMTDYLAATVRTPGID